MSWNNVENNCKSLYQNQYINGNKPTERKILIQVIAEQFPNLPRMRIAFAVDSCITNIAAPMTTATFLTFVQRF